MNSSHRSPLLGDMIPAEELSNVKFASRFPSKGQIPTDPADGIKDQMNLESILNDIPPKATSCLVYHDNDLQKHRPDPPIYPIPVNFQPYRKLKSLQEVFKTLPGSSDACIFSHMFVSSDDVETVLGKEFIRCLEEVQSDITGEGKYKKAFERFSGLSPNRDGLSSFTLAGTVQTKPNILSPVAHSTDRRPTEDGFRELISGLNQKLASLGCAVVQELFPAQTSRLQGLRQNVLDAPLFGSADNHSFSTAQINISALNKANLATSLGYSGDSHIDRHDDPISLSLLICLSRLEDDTHPGKFYLGETREWCTLRPFSLLIFHGTGPHGGTQAKPSGDPRDGEKRINAILYPRKEFVNRTVNLQWPCYEATRVSDYSFFHDGGACFGTKDYHQAWCSRELFRHFLRGNKQFGHPLDDNDLQQAFKSATGSEKRYIDPDSDDGKSILETVAKANKLLERLRPPWQEPRKERVRGPTKGKLPSSTPSGKPPRAAPVSKSSRNQESSEGSPRSRAEQNPASQPRETPASRSTIAKNPSEPAKTRVTRSTNKASKSTEDSSEELKRDQIEKEPESDLSQTCRKPRSGNDSIDTGLDKDDSISAKERLDDSDISTFSFHKSADQGLATVLLKMEFFNVCELKRELELLRQTAKLCPPKFRDGRMPRMWTKPDFGRVASARPLPDTLGTTLVEEMIHLGELFHWITQKNEQLWLYQRHLSQTFHTTLLQVKPMFDLVRLKQLFKDRAHSAGSGICSRKLIDAVIEMIERSAAPDSVGNIFRFDAKKILGEQHQQKFCSSVEVVMRLYHGQDIHAHQAQHFREIAFRMFFIWPLQTFLDGHGDGEDLQLSVSNRTVKYERTANACTKTLRRFLKKLEILQQISQVFRKNQGSFRISQLKTFLYQMSRTLSDKHITQLSVVVNGDERFKESLGLLDRLGTELSLLYKLQDPEEDTSNAVTEPSLSAAIQEFIRFIEVSTGIPHDLRSDERSYQAQVMTDPETFLCFREYNDTYRHLISSFKLQSARDDRDFLARWMMWRLYAWGLPELQGTIEAWIAGPEHVFSWLRAENTGHNANGSQRKACGARIFAPTDLESIRKIWEHGVRIWEKWRNQSLPIVFPEAQRAIRAGKIPMYSTACSAPLLLYGDLSRLGIIIPPTESEMAKVILQRGSAALKALNILGFGSSEHDVKEATHLICDVLNRHLDEKVKPRFHEGQVGVFDLEMALCKVCKKQSQDFTMSPFWSTSILSNKRKGKGAAKLAQPPGGCKRRKLNGK